MAPRRNPQSTSAEISFLHLKNCLVNLPSSLVSLLVNVNTPAQNVVVELGFRDLQSSEKGQPQRSVFLGWTGLPSKRKVAPIVGRDGIRTNTSGREQDIPQVEVDTSLARNLGLTDGLKVNVTIHVNPALVHTINIEPLTPEDWEIIELHATFLELNLLSQIRAIPNPAYSAPGSSQNATNHPLTVHLSPTSTANVKVVSLDPPPPGDSPFAKIEPNAEVIVAPKERAKTSKSSRDGRSVTSKRSSASTAKKRSREERKPAVFLRGVDRSVCAEWFDDEAGTSGLSVWVDEDLCLSRELKGVNYVDVGVVRPAGLQAPAPVTPDAAQAMDGSMTVVAKLRPWEEPPDSQTVALSGPLCSALGFGGLVGGAVKIQPAVTPAKAEHSSRRANDDDSEKSFYTPRDDVVHQLKIYPFANSDTKKPEGLKFGGESKAEKEEEVRRLQHIYGDTIFRGPMTDGMVLGVHDGLQAPQGWQGGIIKFDPPVSSKSTPKDNTRWTLSERQFPISMQGPIPRPKWLSELDVSDERPEENAVLVGIDSLLRDLKGHLSHISSVLLTGGLGSGKSAVAQSLARGLKRSLFFHTTYISCRKLSNEKGRISAIKESLTRVFMSASWGARLGGKALVVLDDLDKICPVETELQVGNDNGRSRQLSEMVCSIVRQYCAKDNGVVLLATAQGKDTLNNVVIGGHVVREIIALKAPDKAGRREILESIARKSAVSPPEPSMAMTATSSGSRPPTADGSYKTDDDSWMDGSPLRRSTRASSVIPKPQAPGFILTPDLDFLDIAGLTDGYMPGDMLQLVSRARSSALMRSIADNPDDTSTNVPLSRRDFDTALKGFTPASLRNVTLQTSTTTFSSIGGLQETRRVLLETLEYPTKYAPIFAQCPLRLRSGLLLYGYPGCGKTLLASAVAGECGLNFISVKGPEILNKYIGASEKSVRDLFERAQAARPCVLFFDEFDSIAPKRGHDSTGVTDRVVNQLLTQMDGAEGLSGVYVLAATSRPDLIDPALLRPGRLDKSLLCDFPGAEERVDILRAMGGKVRLGGLLEDGEMMGVLGQKTVGFTGADLQALVANAQLEAIHDVLGDFTPAGGEGRGGDGVVDRTGRKGSGSGKGGASGGGGGGGSKSFVQFIYGSEEHATEIEGRKHAGFNRARDLAERAAIAAKLDGIRAARRKGRQQQQQHTGRGDGGDGKDGAGEGSGAGAGGGSGGEVVIRWKHIVKALEETRASISTAERRRLETIYREFVVGRSGDMKDGQGSMEVGERSSLM